MLLFNEKTVAKHLLKEKSSQKKGTVNRPFQVWQGLKIAYLSALSVIIEVHAPSGFMEITGSDPPFINVATVRS